MLLAVDKEDEEDVDVEQSTEVGEVAELVSREQQVIDTVKEGLFVALYSDANASELFYACKVLGIDVATEDIKDGYKHQTDAGQRYLKCYYLEKVKEKKKHKLVTYKCIEKIVYVLPYQVFYSWVNINNRLEMTIEEYIFLADCLY